MINVIDHLTNGHSWHYHVHEVIRKVVFRASVNNADPWFRCNCLFSLFKLSGEMTWKEKCRKINKVKIYNLITLPDWWQKGQRDSCRVQKRGENKWGRLKKRKKEKEREKTDIFFKSRIKEVQDMTKNKSFSFMKQKIWNHFFLFKSICALHKVWLT